MKTDLNRIESSYLISLLETDIYLCKGILRNRRTCDDVREHQEDCLKIAEKLHTKLVEERK